MALDELQQIAQARANMMMRGYEPLKLEMGFSFSQSLKRAQPPHATSRPPDDVLGMPFTVRVDMEGFTVLPATSG
jgi:hypothetical protein